MSEFNESPSDDVDALLLNAQLRDELEPFLDESVNLVNVRRMSTPLENEFLASMLAWERAPVLPISKWFDPELRLPSPDSLDDQQLHELLWSAIHKLYDQRIVLDFTDHLSDRSLYCLLVRDILPSPEKKVDLPKNFLHWHCLDGDAEPEVWLRYYASEAERRKWAERHGENPPPAEMPPFPRVMPRRL
jgi:hypothetical protein